MPSPAEGRRRPGTGVPASYARRAAPPERPPPRILARLLDGPLPATLGGDGHKRVGDLDLSAWRELDHERRSELRELVSKMIHLRLRTLATPILPHPLPAPDLALRALSLDRRTVRCLRRILPISPADRTWNPARYLTIAGFGAGCLIDLLSAVETSGRTAQAAPTPPPTGVRRVAPSEEREVRQALRLLR